MPAALKVLGLRLLRLAQSCFAKSGSLQTKTSDTGRPYPRFRISARRPGAIHQSGLTPVIVPCESTVTRYCWLLKPQPISTDGLLDVPPITVAFLQM
jgi:hypothetical protein